MGIAIRGVAASLAVVLAVPALAAAQAPSLSKEQRATLLSMVTAVKQEGPATAATPDETWPVHLMRASDGSHYVAFSTPAPDDVGASTPLAIYVRLARRSVPGATMTQVERSSVEEWLLGQRSAPLPMHASRVVQVPIGELPVGGPLSMSIRDNAGQSSAALTLVERERDRARAAKDARDKERRAELEGRGAQPDNLLSFEDFDMAARVVTRARGPALIERAVTAGPGDYDLVLGWAALDGRQRPQKIGVLRRALTLPPAPPNELSLGSVILADDVRAVETSVRPDQQTAHPYSIGPTEIVPSRDHLYSNDERLALAFQVINASPGPTGKPDIAISFRLFRLSARGEEPVGAPSPLQYNAANLPADFDLALGHPILAAMAIPLRTLPRGAYRLAILAADRISRGTAAGEARFRILATPEVLLAAAPAQAPAFVRAQLVTAPVFPQVLDALQPAMTAPALQRLLTIARAERFAELLPEASVSATDRGAATLFQGIGFYALGDNGVTVSVQLRRALEQGAPASVTQLYLGAAFALDGRDADAAAAWQAAIAAGLPSSLVALPLAKTYVRLKRLDDAIEMASRASAGASPAPELVRLLAACEIEQGRHAEALTRLDPLLTTDPDDGEAQWLALHALFAGFVRRESPGSTAEGRARFVALATRYIDSGGRWQATAEEWLAMVTSSSPAP